MKKGGITGVAEVVWNSILYGESGSQQVLGRWIQFEYSEKKGNDISIHGR